MRNIFTTRIILSLCCLLFVGAFAGQHAAAQCNAEFSHYAFSGNADSIHFYPMSTTGTQSWTFGDGSTSTDIDPWHAYQTSGTYTVCHTVTDGGMTCIWCDSVVINLAAPCTAHYTHTANSANPDSVHFVASGIGITGQYWNFGDGSTSYDSEPWHVFAQPGTYYVCHTVNVSGTYCDWCDSITVSSSLACNAAFAHYNLTGHPDSLHFYPTTTAGTSPYWTFGDGSTSNDIYPWHHYASAGMYYVCHTITYNGTTCTSCDSVHVEADSIACSAHFGHYELGNNPDSIHFYYIGATPTSSYWTFGDGATSSDALPTHVYTSAGTYNVCHTVTISGATCTLCDNITVTGTTPCNAEFTPYVINNSDSVYFSWGNNVGVSYWSFGDGETSTLLNPLHIYTTDGTYYVCHTVSVNGATCTWCDSVTVGSGSTPCNAEFTFYHIAGTPDSIHFSGNGAAISQTWHFGDGTSSTDEHPWHVYAQPGTYYVCHTVIVSGAACTWCDSVLVEASPCSAHFAHYSIAGNPDSVHFYSNVSATYNHWTFGDGSSSNDNEPWHVYATPGMYYVCHLAVNGSDSCTWCDSVHVEAVACSALFYHYSLTGHPDSIHFYTPTTGATYHWNFGDGSSSNDANPWHHYSNPGSYYACLSVTIGSTSCDHCDSVHVEAPSCQTHFGHYALSNPDSIHFYPTGTAGSSYQWDFGDGGSSNDMYPWHHYASDGIYYVCLTVTTSNGATCSWCDHVHVYGSTSPCNAEFSFYFMDNADSLHFYPTGTIGSTHEWHFGDGTSSNDLYPWHLFDGPGTYYVCHTVYDGGQSCTFCDSVTITPTNAYFFLIPNNNGGSNNQFVFNPSAVTGIATMQTQAHVYPNPVQDVAFISLQNMPTVATLKVYDVNGAVAYAQANMTNSNYRINMQALPAGVYFVALVDGQGRFVSKEKLVVTH